MARARRPVRAHLPVGGLRDRASRGDARRVADRRHAGERDPRGRRRRLDRRPRGRGRRRGDGASDRRAARRPRAPPLVGRRRPPQGARRVLGRPNDRADDRGLRERDPMREIGVRELMRGSPAADRVALLSIWFHGHNNPRYAELLPRLERLDACLLRLPDRRIPRGVGFRAFTMTKPLLLRTVLEAAAGRYDNLLALDFEQLARWPNAAVMDADDPFFTAREVELLNMPSLRVYVVTAASAARRYESLGVRKPWVEIPQGVSLRAATPALRAEAAAQKRPGEPVLGWMAAHLLTAGDRGGDNPLYNVDHLLELWDAIRARVPAARLWLVGGPSDRLRERLAGRGDVVLHGRLPREEALALAAAFDVAPYARTADQGVRAAKISELIGLGVPIVSYDYEVTANVRETGAGILVDDAAAFVEATVRLLESAEARAPFAEAAREAGRELDWDVLARRFEREVLDAYLSG